jgi:hypothetical protein
MGGKPQPQMPPPIDTSVQDRVDASEAKLADEKKKSLGTKKKGMGSTILTSGQGVDEEVSTSESLLGGKKY